MSTTSQSPDNRFSTGESCARALDADDALAPYRERFAFPRAQDGSEAVYFCGNSLGLLPLAARDMVNEEFDAWAELAVDGHFDGKRPWYDYHENFTEIAARIVGAEPGEVVMMNSLTTNMHLLLVSFYRPTPERYRIMVEGGAFPSDQYALQSQARFHGFDPKDGVFEVFPRPGETLLRTEDIVDAIKDPDNKISVVAFGGVNFRTGQVFDMKAITAAAHEVGIPCGFDLAHAAGNVPMQLHDWDVDFAAFCTYKYLNAGPGACAGAYVHERHGNNPELHRFAGWWGNDPKTRFAMEDTFYPQKGAGGWQISNAPVFGMTAALASMQIFDEVGMDALRAKSLQMVDYLLFLLEDIGGGAFTVVSPTEEAARGCQVSIACTVDAKALRGTLQEQGVITDFRPPNVIRIAPVPLYNRYHDVWRFAQVLRGAIG